MSTTIALDDRLETAPWVYPFAAGWVDGEGVTRAPYLQPAAARGASLALVDSIAALAMLGTHAIVRDIAVVWRQASMLTLVTHARPDEVEAATVCIAGVSPAGRAVATAVLQPFYGIKIEEWAETPCPVDATHATLTEGAAALIPVEDEAQYQEDLGRAWFLMTDHPFVSHVAVAPRETLAADPASVAAAVERLQAARSVATERGREMRRDLSKSLGVDRDTLVETLAAQTHKLDDDALDGLAVLAARSGFRLSRRDLLSALVTIGRAGQG